jgi:hypothetical protein
MRRLLFTIALVVSAAACKSNDGAKCSVSSIGACGGTGGDCSAMITCGSDKKELRCTAPEATSCTCVDNGVAGKQVTLADPLTKVADPLRAAQAACGWDLGAK